MKDNKKEKLSQGGSNHFMREKKYSAELIISIVKERIEDETSWERLAAKYKIHHSRSERIMNLNYGIYFSAKASRRTDLVKDKRGNS